MARAPLDRLIFFVLMVALIGNYVFGIADTGRAQRTEVSTAYILFAMRNFATLGVMLYLIVMTMSSRRDRWRYVFFILAACAVFIALFPEGLIFLDGIRGSVIFQPFCPSPDRHAYYLFVLDYAAKGSTLLGTISDALGVDLSTCRTEPRSLGRFIGDGISLFFSAAVIALLTIAYRQIQKQKPVT